MAVIDLREPRGPSVQESTANINRVLDLLGKQERLRQDRQNLSDFVSENLRLQGENAKLPEDLQLSPDEISQRAALSVTQKDPQFAKGLQGAFQKFASGLTPGPSTMLTGPIAEGLLSEPTGIRRDLIKSQIEATRALATSRTGVEEGPTKEDKARDRDIAIVTREKAPGGQKNQAFARLRKNKALFKITASVEETDEIFRPITEGLKDLKVKVPGAIVDKMFGKEAFDAGLKEAKLEGLRQGVHEDSTEEAFVAWWDAEAAKKDPKGFGREFQPTSEFRDTGVDAITGAAKIAPQETGIAELIENARKAGSINQEELASIQRALQNNPDSEAEIRKRLKQ